MTWRGDLDISCRKRTQASSANTDGIICCCWFSGSLLIASWSLFWSSWPGAPLFSILFSSSWSDRICSVVSRVLYTGGVGTTVRLNGSCTGLMWRSKERVSSCRDKQVSEPKRCELRNQGGISNDFSFCKVIPVRVFWTSLSLRLRIQITQCARMCRWILCRIISQFPWEITVLRIREQEARIQNN